MSPDSFATGVDSLLERSVGLGMNSVSFGDHSYTDLDFAGDVCLLAEQLELLAGSILSVESYQIVESKTQNVESKTENVESK